jgi:hypothetical protein
MPSPDEYGALCGDYHNDYYMATRKNNRGGSKITRRIGPLRRGELKHFGYMNVTTLSMEKRHMALKQAVAFYGALAVFRKLNAVYVLTRKTSPGSSAVFKMDRDWVRTLFP